jgi:integrase
LPENALQGDEIRALRKLEDNGSKYVFATERGGPFTTDAINRQIKTIGVRAALPFSVHAHTLRHTCGYMQRPQHAAHSGLARSCLDYAHREIHRHVNGTV